MGILDWLRGPRADESRGSDDADTVRRIAAELDELEPERARHIACFAYILGRVAHADLDITADETRTMEELVCRHGDLPGDQAALVVQMAKTHNEFFGGTESFFVTREFVEIADVDTRKALLDCLYAVSSSDRSITAEEDHEIRRIARELRLSHEDFIAARQRYAEHLEVLKDH